MAPTVIQYEQTGDPRDVVHLAVQALSEGRVVAFPTETVYGIAANALDESAVQRLQEIKGRPRGKPLALAIRGADQALDYCPGMSPLARRLAARCWPGPLTLVVEENRTDALAEQLPNSVKQAVSPQGTLGLRVPDHPIIQETLRLMPGPLVLTSANYSGHADANSADEVVEALGDSVDLVLSDGRSKYAKVSTVIRVDGNQIRILREGVLTESALQRLASLMVLVVCTGNTCRSPMGEKLFQQAIADHLSLAVDQLDQQGVMVMSAGIAAGAGFPASVEAARVMDARGLDLSTHESRPLTHVLARFADLILTLTCGHRDAIVAQWPEFAQKTSLLRRDGKSIADPIGCTQELYESCAKEIEDAIAGWMEEIDWQSTPRFMEA